MEPLSEAFFARDTLSVAKALLGAFLVRRLGGAWLAVRIVETEAYVGRRDRACHAYGGRRTARTETLFAAPGTAYVYFVYGMHHCLNAVTEPEGEPAAVLIRGGEPALGHDLMARRRFGAPFAALSPARRRALLDGPGKLCQALGVDLRLNGAPLTRRSLFFAEGVPELGLAPRPAVPADIRATPRIGIDYAGPDRALPWRFVLTTTHSETEASTPRRSCSTNRSGRP